MVSCNPSRAYMISLMIHKHITSEYLYNKNNNQPTMSNQIWWLDAFPILSTIDLYLKLENNTFRLNQTTEIYSIFFCFPLHNPGVSFKVTKKQPKQHPLNIPQVSLRWNRSASSLSTVILCFCISMQETKNGSKQKK